MNWDNFISGLFSLLGVVLGWWLNKLSVENENKPKLAFVISSNKEVSEPVDLRTKTSPSEYIIEIINIGKVPIVLDNISLYFKGKLLIDCFLDDDQRMIYPNNIKTYLMMEQDREALQYHCNEKLFSKCDVIAYCFDDTEIKAELDLSCFYANAIMKNNFADSVINVYKNDHK